MTDFIHVPLGGGTNSVGMLKGFEEHGIVPDVITFADTGGEKPHTYSYIHNVMPTWLESVGFPPINIVRRDITLESECLKNHTLPGPAFGPFKGCSVKSKVRPQEKYLKSLPSVQKLWTDGKQVVTCLGFDAGEWHRAKKDRDTKKFQYWYPLVDWDWDRASCKEAIKRAELPQPGKSSCFFCPFTKLREVRWLRENEPKLFQRAIAMEANANLSQIRGLGGHSFSWQNIDKIDDMFGYEQDIICECYD